MNMLSLVATALSCLLLGRDEQLPDTHYFLETAGTPVMLLTCLNFSVYLTSHLDLLPNL